MQRQTRRRLVGHFSRRVSDLDAGWHREPRAGSSAELVWTRRLEPWIREWLVVVPVERYDQFRIEVGAAVGPDPDVRCPDHLTFGSGGRPDVGDLDDVTRDIRIDLFELFGPVDPKAFIPWGFNGILDDGTLRQPRVAPVPPEVMEEQLPSLVSHAMDKLESYGEPWLQDLRRSTRPVHR